MSTKSVQKASTESVQKASKSEVKAIEKLEENEKIIAMLIDEYYKKIAMQKYCIGILVNFMNFNEFFPNVTKERPDLARKIESFVDSRFMALFHAKLLLINLADAKALKKKIGELSGVIVTDEENLNMSGGGLKYVILLSVVVILSIITAILIDNENFSTKNLNLGDNKVHDVSQFAYLTNTGTLTIENSSTQHEKLAKDWDSVKKTFTEGISSVKHKTARVVKNVSGLDLSDENVRIEQYIALIKYAYALEQKIGIFNAILNEIYIKNMASVLLKSLSEVVPENMEEKIFEKHRYFSTEPEHETVRLFHMWEILQEHGTILYHNDTIKLSGINPFKDLTSQYSLEKIQIFFKAIMESPFFKKFAETKTENTKAKYKAVFEQPNFIAAKADKTASNLVGFFLKENSFYNTAKKGVSVVPAVTGNYDAIKELLGDNTAVVNNLYNVIKYGAISLDVAIKMEKQLNGDGLETVAEFWKLWKATFTEKNLTIVKFAQDYAPSVYQMFISAGAKHKAKIIEINKFIKDRLSEEDKNDDDVKYTLENGIITLASANTYINVLEELTKPTDDKTKPTDDKTRKKINHYIEAITLIIADQMETDAMSASRIRNPEKYGIMGGISMSNQLAILAMQFKEEILKNITENFTLEEFKKTIGYVIKGLVTGTERKVTTEKKFFVNAVKSNIDTFAYLIKNALENKRYAAVLKEAFEDYPSMPGGTPYFRKYPLNKKLQYICMNKKSKKKSNVKRKLSKKNKK